MAAANGPVANGPAAPVPAPPGPPRMQYHAFSAAAGDVALHFQVLDLGRQLYLWLGTAQAPGPRLGNLWLATPTAYDPVPPAASLLRGGPAAAGCGLAQRLTLRAGRPVAVAWGLGGGDEALGAWAEGRLVAELGALGLLPPRGAAQPTQQQQEPPQPRPQDAPGGSPRP